MSHLWWLLQAKPPAHLHSPPPPGMNVHTSLLLGAKGGWEEALLAALREDIFSYLLIIVEIVIKSSRSCTGLPTFIITFFADLYIKLSGIRKQNNRLLLCVF